MTVKRKLVAEIRMLIGSPVKLIVSCIITLAAGIITWLSCNGISVIWKLSVHPPLTPPLPLMFVLWCIVYLAYGVLICTCASCGIRDSLCLKAVVSYAAVLLWCPLLLLAGVCFCSLLSIALSLAYLIIVSAVIVRYSTLSLICSSAVLLFDIYIIYFTLGFAVLN